MTFPSLMKRPSAFLPMVMSGAALALVVGFLAIYGVVRQEDEGTAAHLWQLLMVGQVPIIAFFAIAWLPKAPRPALLILLLQLLAGIAAAAPVFYLEL